jgi:hypothetical protein
VDSLTAYEPKASAPSQLTSCNRPAKPPKARLGRQAWCGRRDKPGIARFVRLKRMSGGHARAASNSGRASGTASSAPRPLAGSGMLKMAPRPSVAILPLMNPRTDSPIELRTSRMQKARRMAQAKIRMSPATKKHGKAIMMHRDV